MLETGLERKVVQKSGSYFSFADERLGQGRQNATAFLKEHPDVVQAILQAIQAQAPPEQVISARLLPQTATGRRDGAERRGRRARPPADRRLGSDADPLEVAARSLRHRDRSRRRSTQRLAKAGVGEAERAEALERLAAARLRRRRALRGRRARRRLPGGATATRRSASILQGRGVEPEAVEGAVAALVPEAERAVELADRLGRTAEDRGAAAAQGVRRRRARGGVRIRDCGTRPLSCRVVDIQIIFACTTHIPLLDLTARLTRTLKPSLNPRVSPRSCRRRRALQSQTT